MNSKKKLYVFVLALIMLVSLSCGIGLSAFAAEDVITTESIGNPVDEVAIPEHTTFALETGDFVKNNWGIYEKMSIADGALISTSSEVNATAKYTGTRYQLEDSIKFNLKISSLPSGSSVMLGLRCNPEGDTFIWNGSMICIYLNLNGYTLYVNRDGTETGIDDSLGSGKLTTPLNLNEVYTIEFGAIDTKNGVEVFLAVNDTLQFIKTYNQSFAKENTTFKIASMSTSVFVASGVDNSGEVGSNTERPNNNLAKNDASLDGWANILNCFNPDLEKEESTNSLKLGNKGAIAYADCIKFSQVDFDFQFQNTDTTAIFMFNKSRRGTFFDSILQQAEYNLNNGYAIAIMRDGIINIQKSVASVYGEVSTLKTIFVEPFGEESHHLTVTFSAEGNKATISVFVDGKLNGYQVIDNGSATSYQGGYISFQKMKYGGDFIVRDFKYDGEVIDTQEGKNTEVKNVYLAQFFEKGKHDFADYENKNILHWSYTKDSDYLQYVTVECEGKELAKVEYPTNTVVIDDQYVGKDAQIIVHTVDKTEKCLDIKFEDVRSDYQVPENNYNYRIAIRENKTTGFAEFYYNDGKTPADQSLRYMPVGSNYVLLKDYWQSVPFEGSETVTLNNYNPMEMEAMLALMAKNSYNSLRVFLGGFNDDVCGGMSGPSSTKNDSSKYYLYNGKRAFYKPYMDNLTDFMTRCQKYGVYVLFVMGDELIETEFLDEYRSGITSKNMFYLNEKQIQGKEIYTKAFIQFLQDYDKANNTKLINTVLALSNTNESAYDALHWPFNQPGAVTLANGKTYDMTKNEDRQAAADEGKIYFYDRFVKAVKEMDQQLLTCEGMFTLMAVGNYTDDNPDAAYGLRPLGSSSAFPTTLDVLARTSLDFFDVHIYHTTDMEIKAAIGANMRSLKYNDEVVAAQAKKPIIMAEFGAFRNKCKNDFETGKEIIVQQRDYVMGPAYHFQGFITWQINEFKQTELFAMLEDDASFFEGELRYIYIQKAELVTQGAKLSYVQNESLDISGLQVKAYYSDGSTKTLNADKLLLWNEDEIDMSSVGDKTVKVLFDENTLFTYDISVKENSSPNPPPVDNPKTGCGGNLIGNLMLAAGTFVLLSAVMILKKKSN